MGRKQSIQSVNYIECGTPTSFFLRAGAKKDWRVCNTGSWNESQKSSRWFRRRRLSIGLFLVCFFFIPMVIIHSTLALTLTRRAVLSVRLTLSKTKKELVEREKKNWPLQSDNKQKRVRRPCAKTRKLAAVR